MHRSHEALVIVDSLLFCDHMPRKIAFVLIDGIGDINVPHLANMTPLQAANTPTLDAIAGESQHHPSPPSVIPETICQYNELSQVGNPQVLG